MSAMMSNCVSTASGSEPDQEVESIDPIPLSPWERGRGEGRSCVTQLRLIFFARRSLAKRTT